MIEIKGAGKICKMCNITQIKLVPLYDHDNKHEGQMCCQRCKKQIRKGKSIEKFNRNGINYNAYEKELIINRKEKEKAGVLYR